VFLGKRGSSSTVVYTDRQGKTHQVSNQPFFHGCAEIGPVQITYLADDPDAFRVENQLEGEPWISLMGCIGGWFLGSILMIGGIAFWFPTRFASLLHPPQPRIRSIPHPKPLPTLARARKATPAIAKNRQQTTIKQSSSRKRRKMLQKQNLSEKSAI
jgi:hypothetical protein